MQTIIDLFESALPVLLLFAIAGLVSPLSMLSQVGKRRRK